MAITMEKMLELLNKDLEWEYSAAIQYIQHSAVITGSQYKAIEAELALHSTEEMLHAKSLSDQIAYLGGVPTMNVEERETSDNSKVMLEQDLKGELHAIDGYKERIAQAEELKLYGLRRALEDILIQEEEHYRDIAFMLGK
jgi:bacterioferritin